METTGTIGILLGLYRAHIRIIGYMLGLYWDDGKEHGSYRDHWDHIGLI